MALEDLIVDQKDVAADLVENLLKDRAELVKTTKGVLISKQAQTFSNKTRVLLFLCGKKAWDLIDKKTETTYSSHDEMGQGIALFGSTLRTVLKSLRDDYLVSSESGKYSITTKGIHALQTLIQDEIAKGPKSSGSEGKAKRGRTSKPAGRPDFVEKFNQSPLEDDYVSEIMPVLKKLRSVDKFLLAIYAAKLKMGLEGLIPSEVNYFLTQPPINLPSTFHISNISRDLGNSREFVNPHKAGGSFEYRLNRFGMEHVEKLLGESVTSEITNTTTQHV